MFSFYYLCYFLVYCFNFFFLDRDEQTCAHYYGDRHLNKMPLEYAQVLSTVWRLLVTPDDYDADTMRYLNDVLYEKSHVSHPIVLWAKESTAHYNCMGNLGIALGEEKRDRIKRCKIKTWKTHNKCEDIIWLCLQFPPKALQKQCEWLRDPPKCMPEAYIVDDLDVCENYKILYAFDKIKILKWEPYVEEPEFIKDTRKRYRMNEENTKIIKN